MMQITCDDCEKIYRIDESRIKGERARLKCRTCDNIIIVTKQQVQPDTPPKNAVSQSAVVTESPPEPTVPGDSEQEPVPRFQRRHHWIHMHRNFL